LLEPLHNVATQLVQLISELLELFPQERAGTAKKLEHVLDNITIFLTLLCALESKARLTADVLAARIG
jgi:hypothetical protein